MASIHIKDFDMHFGTTSDNNTNSNADDTQPFLLSIQNSIAFLKVYLMSYS